MAKKVQNLYALVPQQKYPFDRLDDGTIEILMPRYSDGLVGRVLKSFLNNKPVRIHLDDVGTSVWMLCDGRRSVHEIGVTLQKQFGDRIAPVYDRLGTFLQQMEKNGLIDLSD